MIILEKDLKLKQVILSQGDKTSTSILQEIKEMEENNSKVSQEKEIATKALAERKQELMNEIVNMNSKISEMVDANLKGDIRLMEAHMQDLRNMADGVATSGNLNLPKPNIPQTQASFMPGGPPPPPPLPGMGGPPPPPPLPGMGG